MENHPKTIYNQGKMTKLQEKNEFCLKKELFLFENEFNLIIIQKMYETLLTIKNKNAIFYFEEKRGAQNECDI